MRKARLQALVRQFNENGIKLLLENAANVRDLLHLARDATVSPIVDLIDFRRLTPVRTTFVKRDYRHIEADVILRAPARGPGGRRSILIYILIEHQSEPDSVMPLRVLEYVVQIYKAQMQQWAQHHRSCAGLRLQPVLPIVFYTGTRSWDDLGSVADLVELGDLFAPLIPDLKPVFFNLNEKPANLLETAGGFFGWILRLVQQRQARPAEFQALLQEVVQHLEAMPTAERLRWLEFLSYIHAFVYHERSPTEWPDLQERIEASVQTDQHRRGVKEMAKTIADMFEEKGREEGRKEEAIHSRREMLLLLLRTRFGDLPAKTVRAIQRTATIRQLDEWLVKVMDASDLTEMGIG
jgi:hypothetical protein